MSERKDGSSPVHDAEELHVYMSLQEKTEETKPTKDPKSVKQVRYMMHYNILETFVAPVLYMTVVIYLCSF